jgi:hypothetical protein
MSNNSSKNDRSACIPNEQKHPPRPMHPILNPSRTNNKPNPIKGYLLLPRSPPISDPRHSIPMSFPRRRRWLSS